jgi:hypothetical protein
MAHYVELCCNQELIVITHFYSGYMYVMYYFVIITSVMMPRDDPGETEHPCLRMTMELSREPVPSSLLENSDTAKWQAGNHHYLEALSICS